jgi:cyclic-di-AMP phosphodiesterase PgpH
MTNSTKFGKREHPAKLWVLRLLDNIRSEVTWVDLLAGLSAAIIISLLLVGFRYQVIPNYPVGSIATQDVRAMQNLSFEDIEATAQKRAASRATVPAIYDLDTQLIKARLAEIRRAFAGARSLLTRLQASPRWRSGAGQQSSLVAELEAGMGDTLSRGLLSVLVRHRFNATLEEQILGVLEKTLRSGIVRDSDWQQFLRDQPTGFLVRDNSSSGGILPGEGLAVRNLTAAREGLLQYQLDFAPLSSPDRAFLQRFLQSELFPTLVYDEKETGARREAAAAQVLPAEIHIKKGMAIVRSGEEVTKSISTQLQALRNLQRPRSLLGQFVGFFFFALAFIYALWRYFVHYQSRHRNIRNHTLLILTVVTTVLLVMRLITELADVLGERLSIEVLGNPFLLDYAIPFAFGSILVTLLVDTNLGILTSIIVATLVGLFYGDIYLMAYVFIGSLAGIFSVRQYKDRAAIQKAGLTIGLVNALGMLGLDFLRQVPPTYASLLNNVGFALVSGLLTAAFASMLLPPLEAIFKITTDIRLLELSNLNAPVLRRLSVEAPGTYHHSLMVGTLSEAAAEAIGANPLLVRVASYYHDLGKMFKPEYYVENQAFGINKHESLSPSMSCLIITSHVKDGVEMAKEIGLSERIRDMIPQHHGTRIMSYFFQKAKGSLDGKNQEVDEADFRYPGPKPQSKEAAIMMLADSVEAASRTLSSPSPAQIQGMIDRLVDDIVADHQLDECDITMRDIRLVKESLLKILSGLYHRRIDYPGYDFRQANNEPEKALASGPGSKSTKAV